MTESKKSWTKDFWSTNQWTEFPSEYEGDSDVYTQRLQELDEEEVRLECIESNNECNGLVAYRMPLSDTEQSAVRCTIHYSRIRMLHKAEEDNDD